jgi:hypothetical protein
VRVEELTEHKEAPITEHKEAPIRSEEAFEKQIIKMVIPRKIHKEAIDDLKTMNITAATLFPGLDGFARSLYYQMRLRESVESQLPT